MFNFDNGTNEDVKKVISNAYNSGSRIRLVYGDKETGLDWLEEYDTMGRIGCSTGNIKIPLLIHNSSSIGGGAILTTCIVKVVRTGDKKVLYEAANYHQLPLTYEYNSLENNHTVLSDGKIQGTFKSEKSAKDYILFLQCKRMSK